MFKQAAIEARAKGMHAAAHATRAVLTAVVKRCGWEARTYLQHAGLDVEHLHS